MSTTIEIVTGERFAVSWPVVVQWGDVDRMGHVNNVWYARWIESARVEYFAQVGMRDATEATNAPPPELPVTPVLGPNEGPIVSRNAVTHKGARRGSIETIDVRGCSNSGLMIIHRLPFWRRALARGMKPLQLAGR